MKRTVFCYFESRTADGIHFRCVGSHARRPLFVNRFSISIRATLAKRDQSPCQRCSREKRRLNVIIWKFARYQRLYNVCNACRKIVVPSLTINLFTCRCNVASTKENQTYPLALPTSLGNLSALNEADRQQRRSAHGDETVIRGCLQRISRFRKELDSDRFLGRGCSTERAKNFFRPIGWSSKIRGRCN